MSRRGLLASAAVWAALAVAAAARAKVFLTTDEALRLAFPDAKVEAAPLS
jgi:hypothetical protein